ncbi:hypothetical protein L3X38_028719 [Prunus dulcis]|uniref:CAND6/7 N-terminal domain-containing protein n=1 Tax=Prunus dulcis TaxID=3755 RepID=A0AAD4VSA2_PRUDU|nr:hypothetical protein L3X38_028719 [Prunus dulcis]
MSFAPRPFPILLLSLLTTFFSLCSAEIRSSSVRSDWRPIIPFDEFGFTHKGRLELNVSKIALSDQPNPNPDLSKVGFFLCTRDSWIHVFQQLEEGDVRCALDSNLVKRVYTFDSLKGGHEFSTVFSETDADQYTLLFANCLQQVKVSMDVKSAMYNLEGKENRRDYLSAGKTILPRVYFFFSLGLRCSCRFVDLRAL